MLQLKNASVPRSLISQISLETHIINKTFLTTLIILKTRRTKHLKYDTNIVDTLWNCSTVQQGIDNLVWFCALFV